MTFPTLSTVPLIAPWKEGAATDPTLRSSKDSGIAQTRAAFTRIPWKYYLEYGDLTQADKAALKTFESSIKVGCDLFTHPNTGSTNMRLAGPIKYRRAKSYGLWTAAFDLEEI
ncbi:MAG: hypothetical protein M0R70_12585 [Nitrospirae bacterium]|nr:hypothetical protein [Nitrospirota bacterium]